MAPPLCVIVTGRPGSGKSTLAPLLAAELRLPLVARDGIKEGYIDACGAAHDELPPDTNTVVSRIFWDVVDTLLEGGVSAVIEAAFQHDTWAAGLARIDAPARRHFVICHVDPVLAEARYLERLASDPDRTPLSRRRGFPSRLGAARFR